MPGITKNQFGTIQIPDNVLCILAGAAVEDCVGIVGMAAKSASDSINELLRRENYGRGVKVTTKDGALEIEVHIIVEYGISIVAVAESAMEMVRYRVQNMTGMRVSKVNIAIDGVRV